MPRPDPGSLREALAGAGETGGRLLGREAAIDFAALTRASALGPARDGLAGRAVLVATADQFAAALALIDLDGLARRLLLAPPDLDPAHLPTLLDRAGIEAVVTDLAPAARPDVGGRPVHAIGAPRPAAAPAAPRLATEWVLLTSGTTGVPKMVVHDLEGLAGAIRPRPPGEPAPVWSTFYDIRRYGGLQIFLRAVLGGASLVLSAKDEPVAEFLARLGRHGASHVSGTPSHWRRALMSAGLGAFRPSYVRLSGEIADQAVLDALRAAFPQASIGHAYASTEAGVGFEVTDGREGFPESFLGPRAGGVELRVVEGALRIRSGRTARRYLGEGAPILLDAEGFVDTGDMIEIRDGRCAFVGRRGGIINVGGLKVHPEEVEAVINRHPRVRMSLVEGRRNPITGALVTATLVLDPGEASVEAVKAEILAACRAALPAHKVPAVLRVAEALPVTGAGKLARGRGPGAQAPLAQAPLAETPLAETPPESRHA
ncbi:AMP-dependent synthetase and ligase [Methylobacterium sp. 4-46]|uniref:ANL family adenylate-forming protein n=1 Tax=unclassified Methylobacterium TaxID=2615210 RepID=UPI000152C77B|nr:MULTISPECIES: fatty acid--CoA ligase family protein [Methylobacterium]ACA20782.1 AMP-dependent synthetase and ligase [Methylobacterium sp. 4-46]WFT79936.1 long-chain fatty acid--CoA ligase [Methylobacterium nodulans]